MILKFKVKLHYFGEVGVQTFVNMGKTLNLQMLIFTFPEHVEQCK